MSRDAEFLANYKSNHLYIHPGASGTYATLAGEDEAVLGEIAVTSRSKLAISVFYVNDRKDLGTFKITKLGLKARRGWREESQVTLNHFQSAQLKEFVSIISSLDLSDAKKTRISLDNIDIGALGSLLSSSKGAELIAELASSPELSHDIYAVAAKRVALVEFEKKLSESDVTEGEWQNYFESNPWIFGHGLRYVFLSKAGSQLEAVTTGSEFNKPGKKADGLLHTRAEVSQYVLVEIKRATTDLLKSRPYRSGCWSVSDEVSAAVTQIQKTTFEFARNHIRDDQKDEYGNSTGREIYSIEPKSFLVVGSLEQVKGNDDQISCFELYRRNIRSPEILTFDELYQRARCIIENISSS